MKKLLSILVCVFLFASCVGNQERTVKALKNVKQEFPHSKIYRSFNSDYKFYVSDSTGLKEVECYSPSTDEITNIVLLIELK